MAHHEVFAHLDELRRGDIAAGGGGHCRAAAAPSSSPFDHVYANIRGETQQQQQTLQDQRNFEPGIYAVRE